MNSMIIAKHTSRALLGVTLATILLSAPPLRAETDVTFLLTNPGFDLGTEGWYADNVKATSSRTSFRYPRTTFSACEFWSCTGDFYQALEGVPNGKYTVSCQGFFRDGTYIEAENKSRTNSGNITAMLYANRDTMPLADIIKSAQYQPLMNVDTEVRLDNGKYIPNEMVSTRKYFDQGLYSNHVTTVVTDGKLRIGIKASTCIPAAWYIFDDFKITYDGDMQGFATLIKSKLVKDAEKLKAENNAIQKLNDIQMPLPNRLDSIKAAYQQTKKNKPDAYIEKEISDAYQQYEGIDSARQAMKRDSEKLMEEVDSAQKMDMPELSIKAIRDISAMDAHIANFLSLIAKKSTLYNNVISDLSYLINKKDIDLSKASRKNPIDVTSNYLHNPKFESAMQWNYEKISNHAYPRVAVMACEYWSSTSDTYQTITNLPNGEYILSCQGFYRDGTNMKNYAAFSNGSDKVMAVLYGNAVSKPLTNVLKGAQFIALYKANYEVNVADTYIPNTMPAAYVYFSRGLYNNSIRVKVTNGTLRYGVKCSTMVPESWYIFTNFRLEYCGK